MPSSSCRTISIVYFIESNHSFQHDYGQMFQSFRKPLAQHEMTPTRGHRLGFPSTQTHTLQAQTLRGAGGGLRASGTNHLEPSAFLYLYQIAHFVRWWINLITIIYVDGQRVCTMAKIKKREAESEIVRNRRSRLMIGTMRSPTFAEQENDYAYFLRQLADQGESEMLRLRSKVAKAGAPSLLRFVA